MVHVIAEAIERAGGATDPDKLVTALEATDHLGTMGRIQFYGRDNQFTHALKYGPGSGHDHRHSMAGRQADVRVAARQGQRQNQLPVVYQAARLGKLGGDALGRFPPPKSAPASDGQRAIQLNYASSPNPG